MMRQSALNTIVDVHETSRLLAVAPDFDLMSAGDLGRDDLSDKSRRVPFRDRRHMSHVDRRHCDNGRFESAAGSRPWKCRHILSENSFSQP